MTYEDLYETGTFRYIDNVKNFDLSKNDATLISDPDVAWKRFVDRFVPINMIDESEREDMYKMIVGYIKSVSSIDDHEILDMTNKLTELDVAANIGMSIVNLMKRRNSENVEILSIATHRLIPFISFLHAAGKLSDKAQSSLNNRDRTIEEPKIYLVIAKCKNELFFKELAGIFAQKKISGYISEAGRSAYIKLGPYADFESLKALCSIVTSNY